MFDYSFLGYAQSYEEALKIVQETGFFHLIISLGYLISFFFFYNQSKAIRSKRLHHLISIISWGISGIALLNNIASLFLNIIAAVIAASALIALLRISPILTKVDFLLPSLNLNLKSHQRFKESMEKKKITPTVLYSFSLINESILWILILYRAVISVRAATIF